MKEMFKPNYILFNDQITLEVIINIRVCKKNSLCQTSSICLNMQYYKTVGEYKYLITCYFCWDSS